MQNNKTDTVFKAGYFLRAAVVWCICAAALLLPAAAVLSFRATTVQSLAYVSASVSFLAAFAAGVTVGKGRQRAAFPCAILTALILIALLLTVGFLIRGSAPEPAGVLSVVSFTLAGCVTGALLFSASGKTRNRVSVRA